MRREERTSVPFLLSFLYFSGMSQLETQSESVAHTHTHTLKPAGVVFCVLSDELAMLLATSLLLASWKDPKCLIFCWAANRFTDEGISRLRCLIWVLPSEAAADQMSGPWPGPRWAPESCRFSAKINVLISDIVDEGTQTRHSNSPSWWICSRSGHGK